MTKLWSNKSPEPTAVGAVSSAVAVHAASRRWLSFVRQDTRFFSHFPSVKSVASVVGNASDNDGSSTLPVEGRRRRQSPFLSVFIRVIREIRGVLLALTLVARVILVSRRVSIP